MYDFESKAKISFNFGTIGDKINGAHGHSDIFHFNLEVDGCRYLTDSGTFQYHSIFKNGEIILEVLQHIIQLQ